MTSCHSYAFFTYYEPPESKLRIKNLNLEEIQAEYNSRKRRNHNQLYLKNR